MTASVSRTSGLPLVLAVALPIALLGAGTWHLRAPPDLGTRAVDFDRELAKQRPDVIVFGSSLANRGVDLDVLARELGVPADRLMIMQLPHSSLAHWYALLKNRVYANGYQPKAVVIVGAMTTMLNHDQLKLQPNVERLVEQLSPHEPEIAAKVFKFTDPAQFRDLYARERASRYREQFLFGARDLLLATFFTEHGKLGEARKLADKINEDVFTNANMDYSLHKRQGTGVGRSAESRLVLAEDEPFELRRDGLLDVFQELAEQHGTKVVYVRYPFPPSNQEMDEVPPEIEADAVAWMEELGAGYLDMRALDLDETQYEDMRHMTRQGAQAFTAAVGRALAAMGVLGDGGELRVVRGLASARAAAVRGEPALPSLQGLRLDEDCKARVPAGALASLDVSTLAALGDPPLPYVVSVGGAPLDQEPGGEGCVGAAWVEGGQLVISPRARSVEGAEIAWQWDVAAGSGAAMRWLAPGAVSTYTFEEPWTMPDKTFRVYARALRAGSVGSVELSLGAESFSLVDHEGRLGAVARLTPPREGGWELELTVPVGGSFALLHHLAVGVAPTTTYVLGKAETLHGSSVRVVGGRVEDVKHKPRYATPPPALPSQPRVRRGPKGVGAFDLSTYVDLADSLDKTNPRPNRCSPFVVMEDGVALTGRHAICMETVNRKQGRSCFTSEGMYFSASDDSNPLTNGRTYELALVADRVCETYNQRNAATLRDSYWLYPGDVVDFVVAPEQTASFVDGVNVVEIELVPHVATLAAPLTLKLFHAGELVAEERWSALETMRRRRLDVPVSPPIAPGAGELRVELSNPSKSFVLVSKLSVGEDYASFGVEDEVEVRRDGVVVQKPAPPPKPTPAPVAAVAVAPKAGRADRWSRVGTPMAPGAPKPQKSSTKGLLEARLFALWPVSTSVLEAEGRPQVPPVRMRVGGVDLIPRVSERGLRTGCTDCFLHQGQSLLYLASAGADAPIELSYDPRFPFLGADGAVAWWVYPGTTARFELDAGWQGAAATVTVEGFAFHPKREQRGSGIVVRAGGVTGSLLSTGQNGAVKATIALVKRASGPWAVEIEANAVGAYFLIDRIVVKDDAGERVLLPMEAAELGLSTPTPQ